MKKILIISYSFNRKEIIGSIRLRGLAKFLPRFGYEPIILAAKFPNITKDNNEEYKVIETFNEPLIVKWKKFLNLSQNKTFKEQIKVEDTKKNHKSKTDILLELWEEIFAYPDLQKNWFKPAIISADKIMEDNEISAIISSSMPVTAHLIANKIKETYNIPWIADLRDLWSNNQYNNYSKIRKFFDLRLERRVLSAANAITTVSPILTESLSNLHNRNDIFSIPNGFDPELINPRIPLTDKLSITYTGNLYSGKRDPEILFKALAELSSSKDICLKDFLINFYGQKEFWLHKLIVDYSLQKTVELHGLIPREEVIKKQWESQLLLLLTWDNPKEKGVIPAKIFEYLAAKRPILSYGLSEGCVQTILENTSSGSQFNGIDEIKKAIIDYYIEYKSEGEITYKGKLNEINKFSHQYMTKRFVDILNQISA